jgi:hypothetical protein
LLLLRIAGCNTTLDRTTTTVGCIGACVFLNIARALNGSANVEKGASVDLEWPLRC